MSVTESTNHLAVLARAFAYGARARTTRAAVERAKTRYEDRGQSARYLSEAQTRLDVDQATTTAYMEVFTLSTAMADNIGSIVSHSDALSVAAQGLDEEARSQHGRMADGNRTHNVQMAQPAFIKPR